MDRIERLQRSGSGLPAVHCEKKIGNHDNCNPVSGPKSVPGTPPPKRDSLLPVTGPRRVLMVCQKLAFPNMTNDWNGNV
jgi:hypothetical protein